MGSAVTGVGLVISAEGFRCGFAAVLGEAMRGCPNMSDSDGNRGTSEQRGSR
jgi:hypothetical protein